MVAGFLAILLLIALVAIVRRTAPWANERLVQLFVAGYLARLVVQLFSRSLSLFSHGGGGDYVIYEALALDIIRYWSFFGFGFVSRNELPDLGPTSLPPNLFAVVINLNGGDPTPFGCTTLVAFMACLTCLNVYLLAIELGADRTHAFRLTALFLFSPAYLLYTSDMYKDGPVLFFAVAAVASAMRLSRRFSAVHLAFGAVSLFALWHVRYYLVFMCAAPLFVGLTGFRTRSSIRPLFATLLLGAIFALAAGTTDVVDNVTEQANRTFAHATNRNVLQSNAATGSGVTFDDGGNAFGAMAPKLAYMIFSPFPWAGGSVGFHIGKIDTFIWYYFLWRAVKASRRLWRVDRTLILMFGIVIVPMTVAYATTFANVGLSLRQRLVIVLITAVLAMLSWPARRAATDRAAVLSTLPPPELSPRAGAAVTPP